MRECNGCPHPRLCIAVFLVAVDIRRWMSLFGAGIPIQSHEDPYPRSGDSPTKMQSLEGVCPHSGVTGECKGVPIPGHASPSFFVAVDIRRWMSLFGAGIPTQPHEDPYPRSGDSPTKMQSVKGVCPRSGWGSLFRWRGPVAVGLMRPAGSGGSRFHDPRWRTGGSNMAKRVHLVTGGYPPGASAGHDMDYARAAASRLPGGARGHSDHRRRGFRRSRQVAGRYSPAHHLRRGAIPRFEAARYVERVARGRRTLVRPCTAPAGDVPPASRGPRNARWSGRRITRRSAASS